MPTSFNQRVQLILDAQDFEREYQATLLRLQATLPHMPAADVERYAEQLGFNKMPKQQKEGGLGALALQGGIMGVAAGLTMKLIDSIDGWVKQSKIVGVFFDTVGKAMGLLVDLILLPFLPVIIFVLIRLFQSVMWFGKLWKDVTTPLTEAINKIINPTGSSGGGKTGSMSFAGIDFSNEQFAGLVYSFIVGFLATIAMLIIGGAATGILTTIVTGVFTAIGVIAGSPIILAILVGIATAILSYLGWQLGLMLADYLTPAVIEFKKWLWSVGVLLEQWQTDVWDMFGRFPQWWEDNVAGPFWNSLVELETALENVRDSIGNFINGIILIFKQVWWGVVNNLKQNTWVGWAVPDPGEMPQAASGGRVAKTGLAVIHKGEDIIPGGAGVTVNIYGTYQNDEDLYKKFIDRMRRDQWRQNV
jgi:hypothetical protein